MSIRFDDLAMVIAAGGASRRFGGGRNKLFAEFRGKPVLLHTLGHFLGLLPPGRIAVAAPEALLDAMRELCDREFPDNAIVWCAGGATRAASVVRGTAALGALPELIAVHDAARPLADAEFLRKLCGAAREYGGAVPGDTPVDTIKSVDASGLVTGNLVRSTLVAVGTPQVFAAQPYLRALAALPEAVREGRTELADLTDDAAIFMRAGGRVKVVTGLGANPKITVAADLER